MSSYDKDEVPMLSSARTQLSDECLVDLRRFTARSASMSLPMNPMDSYEGENYLVAHTGPLRSERRTPFIPMSGPLYSNRKAENSFQPNLGTQGLGKPAIMGEELPFVEKYGQRDWQDERYGKNENLLKSGLLGKCNDPYCTTCPSYYKSKLAQQNNSKAPSLYETKFHNALYGDAKGWARRSFSFLNSCFSFVMNPHTKVVQQWNKFFVIACLVAIFVDPLFFYVLSVQKDDKCITFNWALAKAIVAVRSVTDFIYLLNMLLQFKLAYVAPESRVVGAGDLVDHPKKIALHYLKSYFLLDLFIVFPLPQVLVLLVIPQYWGLSATNNAKNLLRVAILLQYIPRLFRFLPLLAGQSASGFIFESAWANFVINLLMFVLAGHVVGSCWYLFGLQRVNQCLRNVCGKSNLPNCIAFIDCGKEELNYNEVQQWRHNSQAETCFNTSNDFLTYGIYEQAVLLSTNRSVIKRYIYSLFWGFQQISTLAGNQTPSDFVWEVLFTMAIVGLGLLLFALLIGNMQNFLLSLGRRKLEMQLRRRDVEQWMRHRRLPGELRRLVRQSERFNWAATQGVNEEMLLENLPEDLQREIRRHLFKFVKKVRIFTLMDTPILDAICERLRQKLYIEGSEILYQGGPVEKMVFIVRGKMESIGGDGHKVPLSEGDVCGEELLTWCLENCSVNKDVKKIRFPGHRLVSTRKVKCLTNVEAFALRAADLEEVTALFTRFLRNPRVQGAIRYESPYWRLLAANRIQVAWRYRQKRLNRTEIPGCGSNHMERY